MDALIFFTFGLIVAGGAVLLRRRFAEFYGQQPEDYEDGFPQFDLKKHLNGAMICEGVIFGPFGRMTSSFTADFDIIWEGQIGVMSETFTYDDGNRQDREWTITLGEGDAFTTTAPDVIGTGKGAQAGPTVQLRYTIKLPDAAGGHNLAAVDWMYLTPKGTIVNRSQFRKFGIKVAELVATIRPVEAS